MKKHLSVFELFVRSSLLPALVLIILTAALQIVLYFLMGAEAKMPLEFMLETMPFRYVFAAGGALLALGLCKTCVGRREKTVYTLERLSVSSPMVFVWQSLCNVLLWLIFLAAEIFTLLFICSHFVSAVGEDYATGQSLMLAFYRDGFLHSLLPMEEVSRWLKNGVYILCLGIFCANSSRKLRRGKMALVLPTAAYVFACLSFAADMGETGMDGFCMAAMLIFAAGTVFMVFNGGEGIEDEISEEEI